MKKLRLISFSDLEKTVAAESCFVIDLRCPESYARGHFPEAVNIGREELLNRIHELPRDKTIVLYCERGSSSLWGGRELARRDFNVISVTSGYSC